MTAIYVTLIGNTPTLRIVPFIIRNKFPRHSIAQKSGFAKLNDATSHGETSVWHPNSFSTCKMQKVSRGSHITNPCFLHFQRPVPANYLSWNTPRQLFSLSQSWNATETVPRLSPPSPVR